MSSQRVYDSLLRISEDVALHGYKRKRMVWKLFEHHNLAYHDRRFIYAVKRISDGSYGMRIRSTIEPNKDRASLLGEQSASFERGQKFKFQAFAFPRARDWWTKKDFAAIETKRWLIEKMKGVMWIDDFLIADRQWINITNNNNSRLLIVEYRGKMKVINEEKMLDRYVNGFGARRIWGSGLINLKRI